jgi:hypothetical protein
MPEISTPADRWRHALLELTTDEQAAADWRRRRYEFAHRLGTALTAEDGKRPAITGSVLYGVWLTWGLIYVGQTGEAQRRLRDLAVGESHHLGNTYPPEIWSRVAVIEWPRLSAASAAIGLHSELLTGLALEHRLQSLLRPLANASRRTAEGGWRSVDWVSSRSRGARTAREIDELFASVWAAWQAVERWTAAGDEPLPAACHVVFPGDLLPADSLASGRMPAPQMDPWTLTVEPPFPGHKPPQQGSPEP